MGSGTATAQADHDYLRGAGSYETTVSLGTFSDSRLRVLPNFGTDSCELDWIASDGSAIASLALPVHRIADAQLVGGTRGGQSALLIAGSEFIDDDPTDPRGVLALITISAVGPTPGLSVGEAEVWPGVDPTKLAVGRAPYLWLFDAEGRRILFANLGSRSPSDRLPSEDELLVAADSNSIAWLAQPGADRLMLMVASKDSPQVGLACPDQDPITRWNVAQTPTGWSVTTQNRDPALAIESVNFLSGLATIRVRTSSTSKGDWELLDDQSQVIAEGTATPGTFQDLGPFPALHADPGATFRLRLVGEDVEREIHPAVRYPSAYSSDPSIELGRVFVPALLSVGAENSGSAVEFTATSNHAVSAHLAWSLRDANGADPVSYVGAAPLLQTEATVPFQFDSGDIRGTVGLKFPIPTDQALHDQVVLWQYWFAWGDDEVAVSEVFGSRLTGTQAGTARSPEPPTQAELLTRLSSGISTRMASPTAAQEALRTIAHRLSASQSD